jgi:hypothetical protein
MRLFFAKLPFFYFFLLCKKKATLQKKVKKLPLPSCRARPQLAFFAKAKKEAEAAAARRPFGSTATFI